jgi:SagB-type dehydrogenase family enzyme
VPFGDVLDRRCTIRELKPITLERFGALLWHAARTREKHGGVWEHRAAPSAGGLHPIELVIVGNGDEQAFRYDPTRHVLERLANIDATSLQAACADLRTVVPTANGALILFAADLGRTAASYENAESLVWRDAGCLIAMLQIVGAWLELGCCPLGVLGCNLLQTIGAGSQLIAAGVAIVGELSATDESGASLE